MKLTIKAKGATERWQEKMKIKKIIELCKQLNRPKPVISGVNKNGK